MYDCPRCPNLRITNKQKDKHIKMHEIQDLADAFKFEEEVEKAEIEGEEEEEQIESQEDYEMGGDIDVEGDIEMTEVFETEQLPTSETILVEEEQIEMRELSLTEEEFFDANEDLEREELEIRENTEEDILNVEEMEEEDDSRCDEVEDPDERLYRYIMEPNPALEDVNLSGTQQELSVFDKLDLDLGNIVSKHGITQRGYTDIVNNINRRLEAIEGQHGGNNR